MIKIKICGLTREKDIEVVNNLQPDYIGFVFAEHSKRVVAREQAKLFHGILDPRIQVVGVFVNASIDFIVSLCQEGIIDLVQLHGKEGDAYIRELRQHIKNPIIQAFEVKNIDDITRANASIADYILLDHGPGGTGETFDWSLLSYIKRPFFLAGGLQLSNVAYAIERARETTYLYGMDTSSGVETNAIKDDKKIEQFIQTVRER